MGLYYWYSNSVKSSFKNQKQIEFYFPIWKILAGITLVSLYINTSLYDPINTPKLYIVILLAAFLLPNLIFYSKIYLKNVTKLSKIHYWFSLLFVFTLLVSALFTDSKYRAFIGESQRRNGFLLYFSLVCISLYVAMVFHFDQSNLVLKATAVTTLLLSGYGFLQYLGLDFIEWNNPYNAVIGTLGNPNFMAGLLSILSTVCFSGIFISSLEKIIRLFLFFAAIFSLFVIIASNALQGLLSTLIGYSIIILFVIYFRNKLMGKVIGITLSLIGAFAVAGMLQKGPLAEYLYKDSVSLRGYYWRAGIEMFLSKPFTGVGVDSYGDYFKIVREGSYPLKYGFALNSNNAHNVPIQFLATAGIFVFIMYVLLNFIIIYVGLISIKQSEKNQRIFSIGLLAAYIAYLAQGFVSIDNIGITVWGWLIGGLIIGNAKLYPKKEFINYTFSNHSQIIVRSMLTWILVICTALLSFSLHKMERNFFLSTVSFDPNITNQNISYITFTKESSELALMDPFYKLQMYNYLARSGEVGFNFAVKNVELLAKKHPNDLSTLYQLEALYEAQQSVQKQKNILEEIILLDPQNNITMLKLAKLHFTFGETEKARLLLNKIISLAPGSVEANEAAKLISLEKSIK